MASIKYPGGVIREGDQFITADFDAPITVVAIYAYNGKEFVSVGFSEKVTIMDAKVFVEHVTSGFYMHSGTPLLIEGTRFVQPSDATLVTVLGVSDRKERFVSTNGDTYEFMYFVRRYDAQGKVNYATVKESYLLSLTLVGATVHPDLPTNPALPGTIDIILEV